MTQTGNLRVSLRGQVSLPPAARHRWALDEGGEVGFLDLGGVIILVPSDVFDLRRQMLEAITHEDWRRSREGFGDEDLENQKRNSLMTCCSVPCCGEKNLHVASCP